MFTRLKNDPFAPKSPRSAVRARTMDAGKTYPPKGGAGFDFREYLNVLRRFFLSRTRLQ